MSQLNRTARYSFKSHHRLNANKFIFIKGCCPVALTKRALP